jgi:thiamine pyrophosphokinase
MIDKIVSSPKPIVAVGGGDADAAQLGHAAGFAAHCVAADSGAALALGAGLPVDAVIGDLDSISADTLSQVPKNRCHRITEQMSTDFEKVLMRVETPLVLGVGFLGGRLDHELAALQPCLLLGAEQIVFLAPRTIALPAAAGEVVSLFPLRAVTGRSSGLTWPIEGLAFEPGRKIGTSNSAKSAFEVEMDAPGMLMILPVAAMPHVVAAFLKPDHARWPVRAE